MKGTTKPAPIDPEKQLKGFVEKFEPKHQALIRAVRKALRKRFPTAFELAYDNYNFFVIGYSSTERPSDSIVSIAAGANGWALVPVLRDSSARSPQTAARLRKPERFIRLDSVNVLARRDVE